MKNKTPLTAILALAISFGLLASCSGKKPEQINLILQTLPDGAKSLGAIVDSTAKATGMKVESQNFEYGGKNGTLKAFLIYDSRASIMVRSTSDEECQPKEGRRGPSFSRPVYSVSIFRTSVFQPKTPLREVASILAREAEHRGGKLVSESENCGGEEDNLGKTR